MKTSKDEPAVSPSEGSRPPFSVRARFLWRKAFSIIVTAINRHMLISQNAQVGPGLRCEGRRLNLANSGALIVGKRVHIRGVDGRVRIKVGPQGRLTIGDRAFLNSGVTIYAADQIIIGAHCRIGDGSVLCDTSFHAVNEGHECVPRSIELGGNVWLGRGVIVLPGVSIGDHSVVAAGAVVFEHIPPRQLWRGNPAVFVKEIKASDDFVRR